MVVGAQMKGGDRIDTMVHYDWRPGRLQVLGIALSDKLEPKERLGKLRCTLGSVQSEGEGSAYSVAKQNWPEFRNANGILIQRAFLAMNEKRRRLMDARYTWNGLLPVKVRAEALGISVPAFWVEVGMMKSFIDGYLSTAITAEDSIR